MSYHVHDADEGRGQHPPTHHRDRRGFLKQVCAGAVAAAGSHATVSSAQAESPTVQPAAGKLPTIKIGKYTVTRLVAGSNPVGGYSHSTQNLAKHMREYFTQERTIEFARRCMELGINTWQTSCGKKMLGAIKKLREEGSTLQWICLTSERPLEPSLKDIVALKPMAIVHHGGVTDTMFRLKKHQMVRDFVKKVQDAGVMAGVSSHNPANIARVAEEDWENELFMTCFYNVLRPGKEIRAKLGTVPLGEPFFESDRDEMTDVMQKVKQPCLGFKILAAGRLCWSEHMVKSAFQYAFKRIKKTDGVIVGMYPKFSDEISHDVNLTLQHGQLA